MGIPPQFCPHDHDSWTHPDREVYWSWGFRLSHLPIQRQVNQTSHLPKTNVFMMVNAHISSMINVFLHLVIQGPSWERKTQALGVGFHTTTSYIYLYIDLFLLRALKCCVRIFYRLLYMNFFLKYSSYFWWNTLLFQVSAMLFFTTNPIRWNDLLCDFCVVGRALCWVWFAASISTSALSCMTPPPSVRSPVGPASLPSVNNI